MKRIFSSLFIILTLAIGAASAGLHGRAASAATVAASPTYYINLSSNGFDPNNLVIGRNSTVVFTNIDTVTHAVTSTNAAGAGPNSSAIQPGQSYSFAFMNLGPFTLVDSLNKNTTATITVVVAGSSQITAPNAPSDTTKGTVTPATSATSATGPVAAGYETSMLAYIPAFILGALCIIAAGILLITRHRNVPSGN